jgi:hypothetical protein
LLQLPVTGNAFMFALAHFRSQSKCN